jgi:hypothetical protein
MTGEIRFGTVHGPVQTGDGVQHNVGGDQYVSHGHQYVAGRDQIVHPDAATVATELAALREALAELRLTAAERQAVEQDVAAMEAAADDDGETDRPAVARHLESLTATLQRAGVLAAASVGLVEPLSRLARWLGPLGTAVLARL